MIVSNRSTSFARHPASNAVEMIDANFQVRCNSSQSSGDTSSFGFPKYWASCAFHRSRSSGVTFEYDGGDL